MLLLTLLLGTAFAWQAEAQTEGCVNTSKYPSGAVTPNEDGSETTISTCTWFGEYSEITAVISGNDYKFTGEKNLGGNLAYITVRTGTLDGAVVGSGTSPLTITAPDGANLFVHWSADADCSTSTGCATTTVTCMQCEPPTCPAPTDLVVEGITETSADFSWTTSANQSDIYLVEAGDPAPDENSTPTESGVIPTFTLGILTVNTDYDVYVRSDCGGDGVSEWAGPENFTTLAPPPDNDSCANATAITLGEGGVIGDNTGATPDGPAMDCAFNGDEVQADVWFSFVTPENGNLTIETFLVQGSDFSDTQMQVLDACGGNVIACDEDGGISLLSKIELACGEYTPSQTYYVQVDGYNGDSGEFKISVTNDDEACDACEMPSDLAIDNITENSAELSWTTDATQSDIYLVEAGDPAPDENSTPTDTGVTSPITLDNLMENTAYDAYVRSDCGAEGVSDWAGPVSFTTLATLPDNDDCSGAIALLCGDSVEGTTVDATESDLGFPSCATGTPADVFYTLDVSAGTEYTVSVQGADYDAVLAIYSGECDNLVEISCADNGFSPGVEETITYTPDSNGTIVIRTYDWSSSQGSFTISVSCEGGTDCEDPYNDGAATSDVYISNIEIAGIGVDAGNPDYDFNYTSNNMSTDGYAVITNPTLTVYPGLEGAYTVSSGPTGNSNQYYYSVWVDMNQDGCFDADEQIIWSNDVIWGGGIPNGETGVVDVPMTWGAMAPGTYQARIRNSMMDHPMAEGNGDGEALDFTVEVISEEDAMRLLGVENQMFTDFTYYPNPVEDQLNLKAGAPIEQVYVYNVLGQKVIQEQSNALEVNLATDQLQAGVYLMTVTIDGSQKTFRVVKE